jgi:hypothetical protein
MTSWGGRLVTGDLSLVRLVCDAGSQPGGTRCGGGGARGDCLRGRGGGDEGSSRRDGGRHEVCPFLLLWWSGLNAEQW